MEVMRRAKNGKAQDEPFHWYNALSDQGADVNGVDLRGLAVAPERVGRLSERVPAW